MAKWCSIVVLILLLWGMDINPAWGQNLHNYQQWLQQQQELVQRRKRVLENMERPAEAYLESLRQNLRVTEQQIRATETSLKLAQQALQDLQKQLQLTQANLDRQRQATRARLRYLGRQPQQRWWVSLLSSANLRQFNDRRRQIQRIYAHDRELLTNLKQSYDRVAQRQQLVLAQANEVELLRQKLHSQKAQIAGEVVRQSQVIAKIKSDRQSLEIAEQRLLQDSQRLQQLISARSGGPVLGTGIMQFPTHGTVSSPYGWRIHPILGYEKFHTGIDFAADTGTPIYAADAGTVIVAEWYGGYGYAVVIDHGNQLSTLYGHCNELYVTQGQTVQKSQVIAAVGSTGFSTGPHLHFEVRRNGEPIDPTPFLYASP
jgi:murein DD-endopeptidase MepM/ murein hydrolase activator NlpD